MREQIIPKIELNVARHDNDRLPSQESEEARHRRESDNDQSPGQKVTRDIHLRLDSAFQLVDGVSHKEWLEHREDVAAHNRAKAQRQCFSVSEQIGFETEKWFQRK